MSEAFHIATAPSGLITGARSVSPTSLDAYFYSFTQAQIDARAVNSDPSSDAYFSAMIASLKKLGWNVAQAKMISHSVTDKAQIPLVACILAILDMVDDGIGNLFHIDRKHFETTANQICSCLQNPPPELASQLDAWWDGAAITADVRILNIGPLLEVFGILHLMAAHFALSVSVSSWRSFISPNTNFSFSARPALMSLNWLIYNPQEAALKARLEQELADKIQTTELDLDGGGSGQ